MEVNETMSKQITETAYLTTENTKRYRPILRYFYEQYERINYMLYKEDVWNELQGKPNFENYTIEMCKNDLAGLVNLWNLTALQDTNNVLTVENIENIEKTSLRNETEVLSLWENLNNDFKRLNQDYQKKIV